MSATALKSTNRQFSSLNYQNFEFFCLVPKSPTHTGLICEKTLKPNISSLGPFNFLLKSHIRCTLLYSFAGDFYFFKLTQPLTVSIKEKGGEKPDRKPYPLPYGLRTETSSLRIFKIMSRNRNVIVRS